MENDDVNEEFRHPKDQKSICNVRPKKAATLVKCSSRGVFFDALRRKGAIVREELNWFGVQIEVSLLGAKTSWR